jgi:hypothetical protein
MDGFKPLDFAWTLAVGEEKLDEHTSRENFDLAEEEQVT